MLRKGNYDFRDNLQATNNWKYNTTPVQEAVLPCGDERCRHAETLRAAEDPQLELQHNDNSSEAPHFPHLTPTPFPYIDKYHFRGNINLTTQAW